MSDGRIAAPVRCETHAFTTTDKCGCDGPPRSAANESSLPTQAECDYLTCDCTEGCKRIYPPDGRWTPEQRELRRLDEIDRRRAGDWDD